MPAARARATAATAAAPIVYRVSMPEPASHEYEIEMLVPALPGRDEVEIRES